MIPTTVPEAFDLVFNEALLADADDIRAMYSRIIGHYESTIQSLIKTDEQTDEVLYSLCKLRDKLKAYNDRVERV